jgi:pyruvate kinase
MRRNRNVKIVATLGPASSSPEMLEKLFRAGVDVFRINMSHTQHDLLRQLHHDIRAVEARLQRPIGILADLQGPKIRIGTFAAKEAKLLPDDIFIFDTDKTPGDATRVFLPHPEIFASARVGDNLLLNDGRLRVEIIKAEPTKLTTKVIFGGVLSDRKGVNLPDTVIPIPALTEKDRADLEAAASVGVDWIALSFVQRADDVAEARKLIAGRAGVMAKIEKPAALTVLETVPAKQKQITRAARRVGKPVIVATQMLESMIVEPVPTRAEVSDVATAVYEGADAIMLSAESATGAWPDKAVATMDRIAQAVERDQLYRGIITAQRTEPQPTSADAISSAARSISETLKLAAIVCYTGSGSTGLRMSRERPDTPIIALTPIATTARRLALAWGLHCVLTEDAADLDDMVTRATGIAQREGFAEAGQRIIITAGLPLGTPGATNMLRIAYVS